MNEPMLGKAMSALEYLSQDAEARRLYEMRQKALHDEASMLEGASEEGERRGQQIGERKSKLDIARNLLRMGMDIPTIAEATGLSSAQVEELRT